MKYMILGVFLLFLLQAFSQPVSSNNSQARSKTIIVDVLRQQLYAYSGNTRVYDFDCVTGRTGKETEVGHFKILRKDPDYFSRTYQTPMPYSLFFSEDGKAIHQTTNAMLRSYAMYVGVNSVGSHGCVGLSEEDAEAIYSWAPVNTRVDIIQGVSGKWVAERSRREQGRELYFRHTLELTQTGSDVYGTSFALWVNGPGKPYAKGEIRGTVDGDVFSVEGETVREKMPKNQPWCESIGELKLGFEGNRLVLKGVLQSCGIDDSFYFEKVSD